MGSGEFDDGDCLEIKRTDKSFGAWLDKVDAKDEVVEPTVLS